MPKRLYENVVIGNFLYGLGFAIGAKLRTGQLASVVNLLQQTPADTLLGDMLLQFPGVVRLIEFKMHHNRSDKEQERHERLSEHLQRHPDRELVSRRVHWFIENTPSSIPGQAFTSHIVPYLDAFAPRAHSHDGRLETWIANLATTVMSQHGEQQDEAQSYLNWLRRLQGKGEVGTGGVVLVANANGGVHYVQLIDFMDLRLEHRLVVAQYENRLDREADYRIEQEHEYQRERRVRLERLLERRRERSLNHSGPELSRWP